MFFNLNTKQKDKFNQVSDIIKANHYLKDRLEALKQAGYSITIKSIRKGRLYQLLKGKLTKTDVTDTIIMQVGYYINENKFTHQNYYITL
jgi:hypothetical protein